MKRDEKLWRILRELDCELQLLGVRCDYGVSANPSFAVETLVTAIHYVTRLKDARVGLQLEAAQDLIKSHLRRELQQGSRVITGTEVIENEAHNERVFEDLVAQYKSQARLD